MDDELLDNPRMKYFIQFIIGYQNNEELNKLIKDCCPNFIRLSEVNIDNLSDLIIKDLTIGNEALLHLLERSQKIAANYLFKATKRLFITLTIKYVDIYPKVLEFEKYINVFQKIIFNTVLIDMKSGIPEDRILHNSNPNNRDDKGIEERKEEPDKIDGKTVERTSTANSSKQIYIPELIVTSENTYFEREMI